MKRHLFLLGLALVAGSACHRSSGQPAAAGAPAATASATPATPAPNPATPPADAQTNEAPEPPAKPLPPVLPQVLAKVNTEAIQRWELETAGKQAEAKAGSQVPPEKRNEVLRGILDELVTYHMLAQEARNMKIVVTDADVDAEVAKIQQSFPTEDTFKQILAQRGVTPQQLREQTRRTLQAQKVVDAAVTSKVAVQDSEVDEFYNKYTDRFKEGDTVHAMHIFIAVPPGTDPTQKDQAKAKATAVLKQLRGGADFATIARTESNDASAAQGGDLGFVEKGVAPKAFDDAAFALKPGSLSDIVDMGNGYDIIKVVEKRAPRTVPLAEVRDKVKAFLFQGQRHAKLERFIAEVKTKTKVQILV
ncbi:MAG: peptidylprolyl isomerase [Acidobacteriota bacterium]